jgi:hypothetical protein
MLPSFLNFRNNLKAEIVEESKEKRRGARRGTMDIKNIQSSMKDLRVPSQQNLMSTFNPRR